MNTMIRFYSEGQDAAQKQAMAFDLSDFDHQLLKFNGLFRERFMNIEVSIPLEEALDLCWRTLAECFRPEQLLMKQDLINKFFPQDVSPSVATGESNGEDAEAQESETSSDSEVAAKEEEQTGTEADAETEKPEGKHGEAAAQ